MASSLEVGYSKNRASIPGRGRWSSYFLKCPKSALGPNRSLIQQVPQDISAVVEQLTYLGPLKANVKWSRYRPRVAQRVGRDIALLFHDRGTRRGWVVSSTPRPHFTPGKDPIPILQEAGWALGPVWTGRKSRPHRDSIPDSPARSQSLYRLSYLAHNLVPLPRSKMCRTLCSLQRVHLSCA